MYCIAPVFADSGIHRRLSSSIYALGRRTRNCLAIPSGV